MRIKDLIAKSILQDLQFLKIKPIHFQTRLGFIIQKHACLMFILIHKGLNIRLGTTKFYADNISSLGTYQSSIIDFYHDVVSTGIINKVNPRILDIGANVGQFASAVKLFYPNAELYCFEPNPEAFFILKKNTKHFKTTHIFNIGLGDKKARLPFYKHQISGMSSFKQYADYKYKRSDIKVLKLTKLDNAIDLDHIDLTKIDVEGFESNVIDGGINTLIKTEYLLIEVSLLREQARGNNLKLLHDISNRFPDAQIVKFGRPLGEPTTPTCQDVLIRLKNLPSKSSKHSKGARTEY